MNFFLKKNFILAKFRLLQYEKRWLKSWLEMRSIWPGKEQEVRHKFQMSKSLPAAGKCQMNAKVQNPRRF
jgi:hypothetical protein